MKNNFAPNNVDMLNLDEFDFDYEFDFLTVCFLSYHGIWKIFQFCVVSEIDI